MEITREHIGSNNEILNVRIVPGDYQSKFEASLKKARRSINMPGFRPGNVPENLVKKMYGKSLLADELNKLVSESLEQFIKEKNMNLLGHPLPRKNGEDKNNFDDPGDFEFSFEVGLSPTFELRLPPKHTFPFYEIEADEKRIETYVEDTRKRYGKHSTPEISDDQSVLYVLFEEAGQNETIIENGISTTTTLDLSLVKDKKLAGKLSGLKSGDAVIIDLKKAVGDEAELAYMLRVSKEKIQELKNEFRMTIKSIHKVEKAEMNSEFFEKVYGKDSVQSEFEFRQRVKEEIEKMFRTESERKLHHDVEDVLLDETKIDLPDDFLKRWLMDVNEKPLTAEQVEQDYKSYARGMKWKLIENKIAREQNIEITQEEVERYAKHYVVQQFAEYGNSFLTDEMITDLAKRFMSKEENLKRIYESLVERKVFEYLESIVKKDVKKVSYDAFIKIVKEHHHHH